MELIKLPKQVENIIDRLYECGYEAYIVGGCVRDNLMGITPHDWDICTSAMPEEVIEVFSMYRVIPTGIKHGTVTVVVDDNQYEITTYRVDGEYEDNRHPKEVEFVRELSEDLLRRDFTINAMAYNHKDGLIDLYNGISDLNNRIIRCVGNPKDRFNEDALRIIRALRFAIRYKFQIESNTRKEMLDNKHLLQNIAKERINAELTKIVTCDLNGCSNQLIDLLSVLEAILPQFKNCDKTNISSMLIDSIEMYDLRLAVLFDAYSHSIEEILRIMKFPNTTIKSVVNINTYGHMLANDSPVLEFLEFDGNSVQENKRNKLDYYAKRLLNKIGYDHALQAIEFASQLCVEKYKRSFLRSLESATGYAINTGAPYKISQLDIDGNDLIELGYRNKQVGQCLLCLLDAVMKESVDNQKENLMNLAIQMKN